MTEIIAALISFLGAIIAAEISRKPANENNPSKLPLEGIARILCILSTLILVCLIIGLFIKPDPIIDPVLTETTLSSEDNAPISTTIASDPAPDETVDATDYVIEGIADTRPGKTVFFGHYEQDGKTLNNKEAIEWIVLKNDGQEALLISRFALDSQPYNKRKNETNWEDSSVRQWLNGVFYHEAFSSDEKTAIIEKEVDPHENPNYTASDQGSKTKDCVFLLSVTEYDELIYNNGIINKDYGYGQPTTYTLSKNIETKGNNNYCWWWLRTASTENLFACSVNCYGTIDYGSREVFETDGTVRPALWVKVA